MKGPHLDFYFCSHANAHDAKPIVDLLPKYTILAIENWGWTIERREDWNALSQGKIDKLSDSIMGYLGYVSLYSLGGYNLGGLTQNQTNPEVQKNLDEAFRNWILYDTKGIESEARKSLDERVREQSLIDTTRKNVQDFLLEESVLSEVKQLPNEKIEGTDTYHLQLIPSKTVLTSVIEKFYAKSGAQIEDQMKATEMITSGVDSAQIDVWIGVGDAILRRLNVQTQINLQTLTQSFGMGLSGSPQMAVLGGTGLLNEKLSVSTVLTLRDVGKKFPQVEVPSPTKSPAEFFQLVQDATKTEEQKKQEVALHQSQGDFQVLADALLKYYVARGFYPGSLIELSGTYIAQTSAVFPRLNSYLYRTRQSGKKYVVYIQESAPLQSYAGSTPYYGITSDSPYPHQLTQRDFD